MQSEALDVIDEIVPCSDRAKQLVDFLCVSG